MRARGRRRRARDRGGAGDGTALAVGRCVACSVRSVGKRAVLSGGSGIALLLLACAGGRGGDAEALAFEALERALREERIAPPAPGSLRVRLAFGEEADLDLFVTDPRLESVYFGNPASRSGGALERDLRCADPSPRIEVVGWKQALPGRYRVSVDFPSRCNGESDPVPFALVVEQARGQQWHRGTIGPGRFEPLVLEFERTPDRAAPR